MAKFKNTLTQDVYIDLGKLIRVPPGECIDLAGTHSCPPLTLVMEVPPPPPKKKKTPKKSKSSSTSGTI